MMSQKVASVDLICVRPDGSQTPVRAWVGMPKRLSEKEWACPVGLDGLYDHLADIRGADSLQSLCLALTLIRSLLENLVEPGGRLLDSQDRHDYPIKSVFSAVGSDRPEE